jgi:hypothetical protein
MRLRGEGTWDMSPTVIFTSRLGRRNVIQNLDAWSGQHIDFFDDIDYHDAFVAPDPDEYQGLEMRDSSPRRRRFARWSSR